MDKIEESCARMLDEIRQLEVKKGPHYEQWLQSYLKAVEEKCTKIAKRYNQPKWLWGMQRFLTKEQARSKKGD
jgi:hypothetical protein